MIDYIDELYHIYITNNDDMWNSDVNSETGAMYDEIEKALSVDLAIKLGQLLIADTQSDFRCGFKVAAQLILKIYNTAKQE